MQIATRQSGVATIVDVKGDIDLYNSPEMRKVILEELRDKRTARLVINLTQVRYIDSSGVASLVEGLKTSKTLGSRFMLFGLSPAAREVLELSRLIRVFEVFDSEDLALKAQ
ncbi:MAG: STAS domain-containing protein [Acidipila sp.]|nr:STAS domain-containing protein [Acidipila sp.]